MRNKEEKREAAATIFLNPRAGGGRAAREVVKVQKVFRALDFLIQINETDCAAAFRAAVREEIERGGKRLVAMGGDGTLQLLANEAHGLDLEIGVLPVGGGNDFARALGIKNWKQGVNAIARGRTRLVDVVKVRFADGHETRYVGGGGAGLDAKAARLAGEKFSRWPGRLRYLAAAVTALKGYSGTHIEIFLNGNGSSDSCCNALLAAALNAPSYGGGLRLAPGARVDDGDVDLVIVQMLSAWEVVKFLPRLAVTGELKTKRAQSFRAKRVRIHTSPASWFHGDGEVLGSTPVEIEIEPKAIRMLVP